MIKKMKQIIENSVGKFGWIIRIITENIYFDYYTTYFMAHKSDTIFITKYKEEKTKKYIRRGK